jgi:hypothetical protein
MFYHNTNFKGGSVFRIRVSQKRCVDFTEFFCYCYKDTVQSIATMAVPTKEEHYKFTRAMVSYTAKKNTKDLTDKEIFERQLVRHYFLFNGNSSLRSSEPHKLQWYNMN